MWRKGILENRGRGKSLSFFFRQCYIKSVLFGGRSTKLLPGLCISGSPSPVFFRLSPTSGGGGGGEGKGLPCLALLRQDWGGGSSTTWPSAWVTGGSSCFPRPWNALVPQAGPSPSGSPEGQGSAQASGPTATPLPWPWGKPQSWAESGLASQVLELGEGGRAWKYLVPSGRP